MSASNRRYRSITNCLIGFGTLAFGASSEGQTIEWVPVHSTGAHMISGNDITLYGGGGEVTLHLMVSDWETAEFGPELGAYQGTVDSTGYAGANADPPNPGADLNPLGHPGSGFDGAFIADWVCSSDELDPAEQDLLSQCESSADCPGSHPYCVQRADFVFVGGNYTPAVSTAVFDYKWMAAAYASGCAVYDGVPKYGGTLILEIPVNAEGTYTIGWDPHPAYTLMTNCAAYEIPDVTRIPAHITVESATGRCCWDIGQGANFCEGGLTPAQCAARPGLTDFLANADCSAECPRFTPCCIDGDCYEVLDCVHAGGTEVPACLGDHNSNGIDDACEEPVDAPTFEWVPVHSTGGYTVSGNDITVYGGGVEVTLHLMVSGWNYRDDGEELGAYQGTIDSSGYAGANADPPNPGVDLNPLGHPGSGFDGAFVADWVCSSDMDNPAAQDLLSRCETDADCPGSHPYCVGRADYVFIGGEYVAAASTAVFDYSWLGAAYPSACAVDDGVAKYGGTLILEIPANAEGTYTIGWNPDPSYTLMHSCLDHVLGPLTHIPAHITVEAAVGRCCSNIGAGTTVCEEDLTPAQCSERPGPTDFLADADCSAGCPSITPCCIGGDCGEVLDCAGAGGIEVSACLGDNNGSGTDDACERAPTIEWVPVDSTGPSTIAGNDITLHGGGGEVTLQLMVSGWDSEGDGTLLGAYQGTVDSTGYSGANADPPNPGVDLNPLGHPGSGFDGAFIAALVCSSNVLDPAGQDLLSRCDTSVDCPSSHPYCVPRVDYVFTGGDYVDVVSTAILDYKWAGAAVMSNCATDDGTAKYGGTLILEIPVNAEGTYTIAWDSHPAYSLMTDCAVNELESLTLIPSHITVAAASGRCCSNIGAGTTVCEEDLTSAQCAERPGPTDFLPNADCSTGCPSPTLCCIGGDCGEVLDCAGSGGIEVSACLGDNDSDGLDDACEREPTFAWMPVASTDPTAVIYGNEIKLSGADSTVTLHLMVSDWNALYDGTELGACQATVESDSYLGANADPPNPGVDLTPVGLPDNGYEGAFIADMVCSFDTSDPAAQDPLSRCETSADCPASHQYCVERADWVFAGGEYLAFVSTATMDYAWAGVDGDYTDGCAVDDGVSRYGGTLLLEVPVGAKGTYTINSVAPRGYTLMNDCAGLPIEPLSLIPALITIETGRCCSSIGPESSVCEDNLTQGECDLRPSPRVFAPGEDCSNECQVAPAQPPMGEPGGMRKNRYLSIVPNNGVSPVAFSVEMTEGPGETGMLGWVGEPYDGGCSRDDGAPTGRSCANEFVARVVSDPVYRVWPESVVHLGDCQVVPVASYRIRATLEGVTFSDPLEIGTIHQPRPRFHADIVGDATGTDFTEPQGIVNVTDIQSFLFCAKGRDIAPHMTSCDVTGLGAGTPPNFLPNVADLQVLLKGIKGLTYLESHSDNLNPADCP
ncbi:MAG: hypothetical protein ACYTFA_02405 [Planctomycetota bacterium]|jgi:hypothetical protein